MRFKILTAVLIKIPIFILHMVNQYKGTISRGHMLTSSGLPQQEYWCTLKCRQQIRQKRRYLYTNPHSVILLRLGSSLQLFQQQI